MLDGMSKRVLLVTIVFLLAAFAVAGCAEPMVDREETEISPNEESQASGDTLAAETLTVVDCIGREVEVPADVERVVDLAILDGTRTMVQLGAEDKLVGLNEMVKNFKYGERGQGRWFASPRVAPQLKDLPDVGNYREPNAEIIRSLQPDLVLGYATAPDMVDALQEKLNVPVVCIRASGCLDFEMHSLVGSIMGKEERAAALQAYAEEKISVVTDKVAAIPEEERVSVFFLGPMPRVDQPNTQAPYDPIDLAGGINVATGSNVQPYASFDITKEQIAVWNPDVFLIHGTRDDQSNVKINDVLSDPAYQTVNAIKNKDVYYTRANMIGWDPAVGVFEVFYMAKLFYPDLFADLDVEKEANEILENFYGIDGLYTDLLANSDLQRWD